MSLLKAVVPLSKFIILKMLFEQTNAAGKVEGTSQCVINPGADYLAYCKEHKGKHVKHAIECNIRNTFICLLL